MSTASPLHRAPPHGLQLNEASGTIGVYVPFASLEPQMIGGEMLVPVRPVYAPLVTVPSIAAPGEGGLVQTRSLRAGWSPELPDLYSSLTEKLGGTAINCAGVLGGWYGWYTQASADAPARHYLQAIMAEIQVHHAEVLADAVASLRTSAQLLWPMAKIYAAAGAVCHASVPLCTTPPDDHGPYRLIPQAELHPGNMSNQSSAHH